jgi:hypothetical protein
MYAPQKESYPNERQSMWVLFDLRVPGTAERLHRERAAWQEQSEIEALDKDHFVLVVYASGVRRLAS